jgi:hypothetical protein
VLEFRIWQLPCVVPNDVYVYDEGGRSISRTPGAAADPRLRTSNV